MKESRRRQPDSSTRIPSFGTERARRKTVRGLVNPARFRVTVLFQSTHSLTQASPPSGRFHIRCPEGCL